jgi:hypothetical protein
MIAPTTPRSCRAFSFFEGKVMNDRVPDLTGADIPDRDRRVGSGVVSTELAA